MKDTSLDVPTHSPDGYPYCNDRSHTIHLCDEEDDHVGQHRCRCGVLWTYARDGQATYDVAHEKEGSDAPLP